VANVCRRGRVSKKLFLQHLCAFFATEEIYKKWYTILELDTAKHRRMHDHDQNDRLKKVIDVILRGENIQKPQTIQMIGHALVYLMVYSEARICDKQSCIHLIGKAIGFALGKATPADCMYDPDEEDAFVKKHFDAEFYSLWTEGGADWFEDPDAFETQLDQYFDHLLSSPSHE